MIVTREHMESEKIEHIEDIVRWWASFCGEIDAKDWRLVLAYYTHCKPPGDMAPLVDLLQRYHGDLRATRGFKWTPEMFDKIINNVRTNPGKFYKMCRQVAGDRVREAYREVTVTVEFRYMCGPPEAVGDMEVRMATELQRLSTDPGLLFKMAQEAQGTSVTLRPTHRYYQRGTKYYDPDKVWSALLGPEDPFNEDNESVPEAGTEEFERSGADAVDNSGVAAVDRE